MSANSSSATVTASDPRRRSGKRFFRQKRYLIPLYLAYLAILLWLGGRIYLWMAAGVGPTETPDVLAVWEQFYPELGRSYVIDELRAARDSASAENVQKSHIGIQPDSAPPVRVLLLGASVLEQVADDLDRATSEHRGEGERRIEICNLTWASRTTRDSLLKRRLLAERHYDVVVIYHGINDVRMNCCLPGKFRSDYSHCQFYAGLSRCLKAGTINLVDAVRYTMELTIPLGEPDIDMFEYGSLIRTPPAFRANLGEVIQITHDSGGRVILGTFALHLPSNYSCEAFKAGQLDYASGGYGMPVEAWGLPENVRRTVAAHNKVIRELAASDSRIRLVDFENSLERGRVNFNDPCHLTQVGQAEFAKLMVQALLELTAD